MAAEILDKLTCTARGEAGLPGEFFTSPDIYSLEVKRFFRRQWFCAGLTCDVALPGDWYPVTVLEQPLILTRDADKALHAFYNVCSHRGARLLDTPRRGSTLVCPYHSWTYDGKGRLLRTPHAAGAGQHDDPAIDRDCHGLREVRVMERGGLVFVALDEPAETFNERIGPLFERWSSMPFDELEPVRDLGVRQVVEANWKIVIENFVESYHLPRVHPELNRINPMRSHYQILGGDRYVGQGSQAYEYGGAHRGDLPFLPGMSAKDRSSGEALYLPPNLLLIGFPDFLLVIMLTPDGPHRTSERLELLLSPQTAGRPDLAEARAQLMRFLVSVNAEDISICEIVQRGRASDAFGGGVFAQRQESTSLQFQQILARCLLDSQDLPPLLRADLHHPQPSAA